MSTKETVNSVPSKNTSTNPIVQAWNRLRKWWDSFTDPKTYHTEESVKERLRIERNSIVGLLVLEIFLITIRVMGNPYPRLNTLGIIVLGICLIQGLQRIYAIAESRAAREAVDIRARLFDRRIIRILLGIVVLSIIVRENAFGIGQAITNNLPWVSGAADHVVNYINGLVNEIGQLWHNLIP